MFWDEDTWKYHEHESLCYMTKLGFVKEDGEGYAGNYAEDDAGDYAEGIGQAMVDQTMRRTMRKTNWRLVSGMLR